MLQTLVPSPQSSTMDRRKIRLTFVATGESVLAEMLDDEAPEVCRIVWDLLPIENRAIHGMYSGAEVFALLDNPQPVPPEGLTQLPLARRDSVLLRREQERH